MNQPAIATANDLPRYVKTTDAARMIGVSSKGLRNLIKAGVLQEPFELNCRLKVFRVQDVVAAVERRRALPPGKGRRPRVS